MERTARSAAATGLTASPTEAGPRRTAGPGRGWGWARRRQLHTFEKPARTVWEGRGRDAAPRLRVLKLGTRPLADTWWGQAFQEPLRGVGTRGPPPRPPAVETSLFLGTASPHLACQSCRTGPNFNFSPEWKRVEFS